MKKYTDQEKEWWIDLHIRHQIRIYVSLIVVAIGVIDFILSVFGVGFWDMYLDLLWIIGSLGLLGSSTFMAIDSDD